MTSNFLDKQLDKLVKRSKDESETDEVRFSLTLSRLTNARVEYLRRTLKMTKQELLHEIIVAAIRDLEVKLGLATYDEKTGESMLDPDYQEALTSARYKNKR
jgi:hypothetical protein